MARRSRPVVALLTDCGTRDWYAACMKGVILRLCPQAQLIDITHEIPPQDVLAGAFTLANASRWFPVGTVFSCVVDPGVGTARPLMAARADGWLFVGPDNGLLSLAFQRAKRLELVRLTNPRYWLPAVSRTFHGRDIIAPVAAHLAMGGSLRRLGAPLRRYQTLALPSLSRTPHGIQGCLLHTDAFGNLVTNLPGELAREPGTCRLRYRRTPVRVVSSYMEGRRGEVVALAGSSGYVELAVREGSAAKRLQARRGDAIELINFASRNL